MGEFKPHFLKNHFRYKICYYCLKYIDTFIEEYIELKNEDLSEVYFHSYCFSFYKDDLENYN